MARMRYTSPNESRRAKQIIIAERPDRLRLEVLSPFGAVFVLAANDGTLAAYSRAGAHRALFGLPSAGPDVVLPLLDSYAAVAKSVTSSV